MATANIAELRQQTPPARPPARQAKPHDAAQAPPQRRALGA